MRLGTVGVAGMALVVAALGLSGCSADSPQSATSTDPQPPADTTGTGAAVLDANFADPDVLEVDGVYYAYATNDNNRNVQLASSTDLLEWTVLPDALPDLPSWIIPGKTWAPEVTEITPGSFAMYFTATNFQPTLQCIGVATATDPAGPFTVQGDKMLICPADEGGAIDASTAMIDGTLQLLWKNDGNCCSLDTWLQATPLSADGLSTAGGTTKLIMQTEEWEGDLVEAPTLVDRGDQLVLLYSANAYSDDRYAVGAATAPTLGGPWLKEPAPILSTENSDGAYRGPGGQDLVVGPDGADYLAFHGWDANYTYRALYVAPVEWDGDIPQLANAASTP
ncbi:GH43 family beta-xylosidase [Glaciihabitans tibetensis]|uniref:GH43 family beta-xylosidase n=1 Tax=Glaciihabitans tibetensis TaxID=1266600 RepID=A0A2T0VA37_9MICO|nr:glycoside hydrolase family 43 protein [Glaciihabitans tibetensis]PRY67056.1 GH43 family beta-xylosidase [Glaciihabitans tibetensis]